MGNTVHLLSRIGNPNDEWYTPYEFVERELEPYKNQFKNKKVLCNCDDYEASSFAKYFMNNFKTLELKELCCTSFCGSELHEGMQRGKYLKFDGDKVLFGFLEGQGEFDSEECKKFLADCDVVVTNPPFSRSREHYALIKDFKKDFWVVAHMTFLSYSLTFNDLKDQVAHARYVKSGFFTAPDGVTQKKINTIIISSLKRDPKFDVVQKKKAPPQKYDNIDALEINKLAEIPKDYDGVLGVPITALTKPQLLNDYEFLRIVKNAKLNGRRLFERVLIKKKEVKNDNVEWGTT